MTKLANKVALVTGASKGIGAGIAKLLAEAGASVVVNYATSKDAAESVVKEIEKSGGKAIALPADVSKKAEIEKLFAECKKNFGSLDILVNNAGIYKFLPLEKMTEEEFHKQFNLNVLGLLLCCQEALKYFGDDGGSIINISSIASTLRPAEGSIYSGTKGAVDAITGCLAKELGARKIRVNSVNPGLVITEGVHEAGMAEGAFRQEIESMTPLKRIGLPEDIAPLVLYLACPDSAWVTGECWRVSGGFV